jgi:hypothetical protein
MTETLTSNNSPTWWRVHDIVVGLLAGFGVGIVGGLFVNRLMDNNLVVLSGGIVGALIAIYVLIQSHGRSRSFLNAVVVVTWVLLALSALFLAALIQAILNFE